jgi:hypothetical protein
MVDEEDRKGRGGGGNRYRRAHITSFRASGWVDRSIFVFLLEVEAIESGDTTDPPFLIFYIRFFGIRFHSFPLSKSLSVPSPSDLI